MLRIRFLLWGVLLALVAAQALGLMHRVVHPQLSGEGPARQAAPAHDHVHQNAQGWVAALFSTHADDNSCRLFDPLHPEGALTLPALWLPAALSSHFLDFSQGECLARWAALYDARGPPSLR